MPSNLQVVSLSTPGPSNINRDLAAAILSGQAAGVITLGTLVGIFTMFVGTSWYHPVQLLGAFVLGDEALPGSFSLFAFIMGVATHQLIASLMWSLVFGVTMNRVSRTWSNVLALGLATAVLMQVVNSSLIIPELMQRLHGHNIWAEHMPLAWSWAAHLVFGLSFLLFIPIRQALPRPEQR